MIKSKLFPTLFRTRGVAAIFEVTCLEVVLPCLLIPLVLVVVRLPEWAGVTFNMRQSL